MINLSELQPPVRDTEIRVIYDADSILYLAGFVTQHKEQQPDTMRVEVEGNELWVEPLANALYIARLEVEKVKDLFRTEHVHLYFTKGGGFRNKAATIKPYKGQRKTPRPYHYEAIFNHLCEEYPYEVEDHYEADDVVCMEHKIYIGQEIPSVMVHADKDLNMMPGWHYNPRKEQLYFVSESDGVRNFFKQLIMGDTTDNIGGIPRQGEAAARKALEKYPETTHCELLAGGLKHDCLALYKIAYDKGKFPEHVSTGAAAMDENAQLLWMVRDDQEYWDWETQYVIPRFKNIPNISEMIA